MVKEMVRGYFVSVFLYNIICIKQIQLFPQSPKVIYLNMAHAPYIYIEILNDIPYSWFKPRLSILR